MNEFTLMDLAFLHEHRIDPNITLEPEPGEEEVVFDTDDGLGACRGFLTAIELIAFFGLVVWIAIEVCRHI